MLDLPVLSEYEVSPKTGFLPEELPLERLSDEYYKPWEQLGQVLPSLILTRKIRKQIENLPVLSIDRIKEDKRELRRAYSLLGFLSHAYVWNFDVPTDVLPKCLAEPLLAVSELLELPPLATYAGLVLWNFKPIFPLVEGEEWDLDNLSTITTYTGSIDECWFYLVSVYFEYKGADCITDGLEAIKNARDDNTDKVIESLQKLAESIDRLGSLLMKMEEMCDPHTFYFRIRPYFAGWSNMADAGLPHGLKYGDETEYRKYAGGSNAQSSMIQTLDILLNIEHLPTGEKRDSTDAVSSKSGQNNFMNEMRKYMPGPHRRFLGHLSQVSNIRDYVLTKKDAKLTLAYDACLAMLKSFRDKHIQIVTRYVILQAKSFKKAGSSNTLRSGISRTAEQKEPKGTGGTSLIPFLKQCRDETGEQAASDWGKKVLSSGILNTKPKRNLDEESTSDAKRAKLGLSADWSNEGEQPGHW